MPIFMGVSSQTWTAPPGRSLSFSKPFSRLRSPFRAPAHAPSRRLPLQPCNRFPGNRRHAHNSAFALSLKVRHNKQVVIRQRPRSTSFQSKANPMFDCAVPEKSPFILIVDDDEDDVFLMMSVLRRVGWETGEEIECGSVDNGADALALVSLKRMLADLPVAVILDLNMPKLDGMSALKALRQSLGFGELPVFVLTTTANQAVHSAAMALGATKTFVKPNSKSELTDIAREILQTLH
ncbi:response regulator [Rhodoblastus acidophilus]|uniref:Response regulator n=2 Tax=Rhodoblastus acidophilus TaxID=1074 RepID=A0A6N8DK74_RHOAC|nr:response regulator [Rhodoblastus acidophilus]